MAKNAKKLYTEQQMEFMVAFCSPNTKTFQNIRQSALKAGYSESYANNITTKDTQWIEDLMGVIVGKSTDKKNLVEKSKKVLSKSLDSGDQKLAQDTAKFIASTTAEFSKKGDVTTGGDKMVAPVTLVEFVDGEDE